MLMLKRENVECRKNTFQYPVSSVTKANLTILIEFAKAIAWKRQREQKWDAKDVVSQPRSFQDRSFDVFFTDRWLNGTI